MEGNTTQFSTSSPTTQRIPLVTVVTIAVLALFMSFVTGAPASAQTDDEQSVPAVNQSTIDEPIPPGAELSDARQAGTDAGGSYLWP